MPDLDRFRTRLRRLTGYLPAVWLILTAVFFFLRFSMVFYEANRTAIDRLFE
jgi:hypothetical protein